VMVMKGKKLHPDNIQEIRGFAMIYKGLATFTMTYKEWALSQSEEVLCWLAVAR
jgi:hypothetical protein